MSKKMSQNLFNYATSELSQDAFISLLIAWFDSEDRDLSRISEEFIIALYKHYHGSNAVLKIRSIDIKQQYHKIDVYFEITNSDGDKIPFIIEDKTWTEPHSKQLVRYVQKVSGNKEFPDEETNKSKEIIKIFFKTGHLTEKDKNETKHARYVIIDSKWFYDFLKKHHHFDNVIFKHYFEFLENEFYTKLFTNGRSKELIDWKPADSKEGYVQYALIEKIKHLTLGHADVGNKYIKYTRNGKQWKTWWKCWEADGFSFIVNIVKKKNGYCLRLMEYSSEHFKVDDKKKTLASNIKTANDIIARINNCNISVDHKPRYKAREAEIAVMNLSDVESLDIAAKKFSSFLKLFIDHVK